MKCDQYLARKEQRKKSQPVPSKLNEVTSDNVLKSLDAMTPLSDQILKRFLNSVSTPPVLTTEKIMSQLNSVNPQTSRSSVRSSRRDVFSGLSTMSPLSNQFVQSFLYSKTASPPVLTTADIMSELSQLTCAVDDLKKQLSPLNFCGNHLEIISPNIKRFKATQMQMPPLNGELGELSFSIAKSFVHQYRWVNDGQDLHAFNDRALRLQSEMNDLSGKAFMFSQSLKIQLRGIWSSVANVNSSSSQFDDSSSHESKELRKLAALLSEYSDLSPFSDSQYLSNNNPEVMLPDDASVCSEMIPLQFIEPQLQRASKSALLKNLFNALNELSLNSKFIKTQLKILNETTFLYNKFILSVMESLRHLVKLEDLCRDLNCNVTGSAEDDSSLLELYIQTQLKTLSQIGSFKEEFIEIHLRDLHRLYLDGQIKLSNENLGPRNLNNSVNSFDTQSQDARYKSSLSLAKTTTKPQFSEYLEFDEQLHNQETARHVPNEVHDSTPSLKGKEPFLDSNLSIHWREGPLSTPKAEFYDHEYLNPLCDIDLNNNKDLLGKFINTEADLVDLSPRQLELILKEL